jgi:predicted Zn-dependent protease
LNLTANITNITQQSLSYFLFIFYYFCTMPPFKRSIRTIYPVLLSIFYLYAPTVFAKQTTTNQTSIATKTTKSTLYWDETTVSAFLSAELLAQNKQFETAALILWNTAQSQPLPVLLERVIQWAMLSRRFDISYDAAELWENKHPKSKKAQEWLNALLILNERYDDLSKRLNTRYNLSKVTPSNDDLVRLAVLVRNLNLAETQRKQVYSSIQTGLTDYQQLGDVQFLYGLLAQQANLKTEAQTHLKQARTAVQPSALAILSFVSKEPNTALKYAQTWTKRQPNNHEAWHTLAQIQVSLKQPSAAISSFNQALKHLPTSSPKTVYLLLARMEQERLNEQFDAARISLKAAYTAKHTLTEHQHTSIARTFGQELADALLKKEALNTYQLAEKLNEATNQVKTDSIELFDNSDEFNAIALAQKTYESLMIKGLSLSIKAKMGDRKALNELLNLQTNSIETVRPLMAMEYRLKENLTTEILNVLTYTTIDTLHTVARRHLKQTATNAQALSDFETALKLCKQLPEDDGLYETAITYDLTGRVEESVALLRDLLIKQPKNASILNALGYGLVDRNVNTAQVSEGVQLLEEAHKLMPDNVAIIDSLGWGYFRMKQYQKALPLLKKAHHIRPADGEIAAHFGELLFVMGQAKAAQSVWLKAFKYDALHPVLIETMQRFNVVIPKHPAHRNQTTAQ